MLWLLTLHNQYVKSLIYQTFNCIHFIYSARVCRNILYVIVMFGNSNKVVGSKNIKFNYQDLDFFG